MVSTVRKLSFFRWSIWTDLGGQFRPFLGGQFEPGLGGQFKPGLGGQFHRFFQCNNAA